MYAGAALSAVVVIVTLVTVARLKHGFLARHPDYTAAQRDKAEIAAIVGVFVWLVGLGAIILPFSKESGPYFARPASPPG
jgi:hypothetical protein